MYVLKVDEGFLKGPHYILVADHGGMIQALPVASPVNKVLYSMDEGVCWHEEAVNQTPAGFKLKGTMCFLDCKKIPVLYSPVASEISVIIASALVAP